MICVISLGDGLKTTDIELLLPVTGERAMVQVKSQTSQAQLDDYIAAFARWDMQRLTLENGGA